LGNDTDTSVWADDPIAAVRREFAELRTDHTSLVARVRELESRLASSIQPIAQEDGPCKDSGKEVAAADVILALVVPDDRTETGNQASADHGHETAALGRRVGKGRSSRASRSRSSLISEAVKLFDNPDEDQEKWQLADSMWDACIFLCSKRTAGVGWLVTIWAIAVFLLNLAVQATIIVVVVQSMATNADIDDETVQDLRCACARLQSPTACSDGSQRWSASCAGSIAQT
jgi:hypothetical protein